MKKIVILVILLSAAFFAKAQVAGGSIAIDDLTARIEGETVVVSYTAAIARGAVKRDHTLLFAPVIAGGGFRQSLPAVAVHGPGSKIARERRQIAFGTNYVYENATIATNGETVATSAVVPFQKWMHGADIIIESVLEGCCATSRIEDLVAANNILPLPEAPPAAPEPELPLWVPVSVADSLSTAFPFVVPFSEFDPDEPFKLYDDDRENGLEIYFPLAKYDIRPDYLDNSYNLNNLVGCINMIASSGDSRVAKIIVAGFASPEGTFALNDRLAFERAVSLKKYIIDNTVIRDDQVALFNGSVDWRGLRARIARGTLPEKEALLRIIDQVPVAGLPGRPGRFEELKKINSGRTYRYLQAEHFPYLRSGAFIKVFYENR